MKSAHRTKLIIYSAFTLLCMALIFAFSAQNAYASQELSNGLLAKIKALIELLPSISGQGADHDIRKYAHMFEFSMLGISSSLLAYELVRDKAQSTLLPALAAWAYSTFYACTDEFHQLFVPGRSAELRDVAVDSCGALVGVIIILLIMISAKRKGSGGNE